MTVLKGLAGDLFSEVKKLKVIDTHEHLPSEADRIKRKIDVTTLFSHYMKPDLEAAGLPFGPAQAEIFDTSTPLMTRWRKLKPFFEAVRHGAAAYPAFAYVRDILGFDDINDATIEAISDRMQGDNREGLYRRLFRDACNIECCIMNVAGNVLSGEDPLFRYLSADIVNGISGAAVTKLEEQLDMPIYGLGGLVAALNRFVEGQKRAGAVGLKITSAYYRNLGFEDVTAAAAEEVLLSMRSGVRPQVSARDQEVLENYLLRREIEACIEQRLPIAIHTGFQYWTRNDIRNARATQLWPLLKSYPRARFDLFHGSAPYVSDMTVIGKYFQNVSLNMCYMHILSPEIARRALREWLDAVPVTKIFAFGGDYGVPEKVYGHLRLAQADVSEVLADAVERGRFRRETAMEIARLFFYENPKRWYGL